MPVGTDLRETGGQDHRSVHARLAALSEHTGDRARGHTDDGEVDVVGHVGDRRVALQPADARGVRVDRVHDPGKAVLADVAQHRVADGSSGAAGTDHRDHLRGQEPCDGPGLGDPLPLGDGSVGRDRQVELEVEHPGVERPAHGEAGVTEDVEHLTVVTQGLRVEPLDAVRECGRHEMLEQQGPDALCVMSVRHRERNLGARSLTVVVVRPHADQFAGHLDTEREPVAIVDIEHLRQLDVGGRMW